MMRINLKILCILLNALTIHSFNSVPKFSHTVTTSRKISALKAKNIIDAVDTPKLLKGTILENKKLRRIYQASKDGWTSKDFHRRVDCGLASVVCGTVKKEGIFASGKPDIIGGFNPFGWNSVDDYRNTLKSFVFRVDGKTGEVLISKKTGGADGAIYDFGSEGPCFGVEALKIPLNPAKLTPIKAASSLLIGNDYARIGNTGSLFGSKVQVVLTELEVYVDAAQKVVISGDLGAGTDDGFSWGGYGR